MTTFHADPSLLAEVVPGVRGRRIIDREHGSGAVTLGDLEIEPGASLPLHRHRVEEVVMILSGHGRFELDGVVEEVGPGAVVLTPAGVAHGLSCVGTEPLRIYFTFPAVDVDREWIAQP